MRAISVLRSVASVIAPAASSSVAKEASSSAIAAVSSAVTPPAATSSDAPPVAGANKAPAARPMPAPAISGKVASIAAASPYFIRTLS